MGRITKQEYETLASFRYSLRHFLHYSEGAARAAGLTPQHHQALLAIRGFPGRDRVTVGELAERMLIRHHSAVELADRLSKEGLITRQHSAEDRRQVWLSLTRHGTRALELLSASHRDELRRTGPRMLRILKQLSSIDS